MLFRKRKQRKAATKRKQKEERSVLWSGAPFAVNQPVNRLHKHYVLTPTRVIVKTGILGDVQTQLDLYTVTDITVRRSIGKKLLFGTGDITIACTGGKSVTLANIRGARQVADRIYAAVNAERHAHGLLPIDMIGRR